MTCDEVELLLVTSEPLPEAAATHLTTCEKCRTFQSSALELVAGAALPAPGPEVKAALQGLAPKVHQAWKRSDRRRSFAQRVLGLAVAACLGAAVASAALLPRLQSMQRATAAVALPEVAIEFPEPVSSSDTDDELDVFEVSWPSP